MKCILTVPVIICYARKQTNGRHEGVCAGCRANEQERSIRMSECFVKYMSGSPYYDVNDVLP